MKWQERIVADKDILLGKPAIKGTRISVELILELFEQGWTTEMLLQSYPNLTDEDIAAVFSFLKDCMQQELYFAIKKSA